MQFSNALAALGLLATAICASVPVHKRNSISVKFTGYNGTSCGGEPAETNVGGFCENFDKTCSSYTVAPHTALLEPWLGDDFHAPDCSVVVYAEDDCKGEGYTVGPFYEAAGMGCIPLLYPGKSASASCDFTRQFGVVPPKPNIEGLIGG